MLALIVAAVLSAPTWVSPLIMHRPDLADLKVQFRDDFLKNIKKPYGPANQQEENCYWAAFLLGHLKAEVLDRQADGTLTPAINKVYVAASGEVQKYYDDNCSDPGLRKKITVGAIHVMGASGIGSARDIQAAYGGITGRPVALPAPVVVEKCRGVLTTSGVCLPDRRLVLVVAIIVAALVPGPADDAVVLPMIVRLARAVP